MDLTHQYEESKLMAFSMGLKPSQRTTLCVDVCTEFNLEAWKYSPVSPVGPVIPVAPLLVMQGSCGARQPGSACCYV